MNAKTAEHGLGSTKALAQRAGRCGTTERPNASPMRCRVPSRLYCISWLPGCRIRRSASGSAGDFAVFDAGASLRCRQSQAGMRSPLTCTSMQGAAPSCFFASSARSGASTSSNARVRAARSSIINDSRISNFPQQSTFCNEDVWRRQGPPACVAALSKDDSAVIKLLAVLTRRARPVGRPTRRSMAITFDTTRCLR